MAIEGSGRLAWSAIDKGIAAEWESAYKTLQALLATEIPLTVHIEVLIGPGAAPGSWKKFYSEELANAPTLIVDKIYVGGSVLIPNAEAHAGSNGYADLASEANVTEVTRAAQADPEPQANPQTPSLREVGETILLTIAMTPAERTLFSALEDGNKRWRKLSAEERTMLVHGLGHSMTLMKGLPVRRADWEAMRPKWAPSASALTKTYGGSWKALSGEWSVELTPE